MNSEEVKALLAAINILIEIKILIRQVAPNYNLDDNLSKKYMHSLKKLQLKLQPIFTKYLDRNDFKEMSIDQKESNNEFIKQVIKKNTYIIISASSSRKILKNFGVDPRNLVVTGGPLFTDNYKKVNPMISNNALLGIKKKSDNLVNQIKKILKSGKDLLFIYEKENLTDQIILSELEQIEEKLNKKIKKYKINSWNIFDN